MKVTLTGTRSIYVTVRVNRTIVMTSDEARDLVDRILVAANQQNLNDLQSAILHQTWAGGTSAGIAQKLDYKVDYINQVAARLWKTLSDCLGEPVSKKNIQTVLNRYDQSVINPHRILDWGESSPHSGGYANDVSQFYGRETDIETLTQWVVTDRCRSIGIFGIGGIGKTAFSVKFTQTIQADFDVVIWRSLRQAPTLKSLLTDILPVLSGGEVSNLSINSLLIQLRQNRCLIVFDNVESIMAGGEFSGSYLPGYEDYSHVLERICDESHQSCLLVCGREKPGLFNLREGPKLPVRAWQLQGLSFVAARQILSDKGSIATDKQLQILIDRLGGNPLALKIVASNINNLFNNDTSAFLAQGDAIFGSLRQLLAQQFQRFSLLQQQIMYWLAIVREGIQPVDLQAKIVPTVSLSQVLAALLALRDRAAIESTATGLTQQPVVMEYVIDRFINNIVAEIISSKLDLFATHALIEARARDYVRDSQTQIILYSIGQQLLQHFGSIDKLVLHLREMLDCLRFTSSATSKLGDRFDQTIHDITDLKDKISSTFEVGTIHELPLPQISEIATKKNHSSIQQRSINYTAGNILNLLCHLKIDLHGWDFSCLKVRQAYLAEVLLRHTNFDRTHFTETVFAETFGSVLSLAYSPDGKLLATSGTNSEIKIWDADTYQEILCCQGHKHWVMFVCFSPDSRYLASASDDYTVKLWDVSTGQCLHTYLGHTDSVNVVAFSPDGKLIATGAQDSTIRLESIVPTDSPTRILVGHKRRRVWTVAFSPDGKTLASGGEDKTIRLWDISTGTCLAVWVAHVSWVRSVAFSPDGQILASSSPDRTIKLWSVHNQQCLQIWHGHQKNITSVAFSSDGSRLVSGSSDRTVKLWDIMKGKCFKTFFGHSAGLWQVAYHPHGHQVASGGEDHAAKIWNLHTGACTKTLTGHTNAVLSVAASPNGAYVASAHEDRTVIVWDVQSGKIVQTLRDHTNTVWSVAFSSNGEFLISGSADETIKLWHWQTGKLLKTFYGHQSWVWIVAFAPDNLRFASGSYDQTVKVWNIATGECLQTFIGHTSSVSSLDFSPDGKLLASSSYDNTIRIWNLATGRCDRIIKEHQNSVWSLNFSPDGKYLVSGSFDRTVKLWSVDIWECVRTYVGHQEFVKAVKFTPDSRQIVSGGFGGELKVWHIDLGECLHSLIGHLELIYMLDVTIAKIAEFTAPKLLVFSASLDKTIKVWDLESAECLNTWKPPRPYEGMSIEQIGGINESQVASLQALGAI
jgi:WD40 repeat protein